MENEQMNNEQLGNQQQPEKSFSQADVDRIVGERLQREREKYEADARRAATVANARGAWVSAGMDPADFDGLEMDENGRIHIDKAIAHLSSLRSKIGDLTKAREERKRENLPRFGGSVHGYKGPETDPLADVFKAPRDKI